MIEYSIHVTLKTGDDLTIKGKDQAVERIIEVLEAAGFKYLANIETWDEGYYQKPEDDFNYVGSKHHY